MTIRPSAARQVQECIAALSSPRAATREGAVARLIVIGTRAVGALTAVATDAKTTAAARAAALRALEGIGGSGPLDVALGLLGDASNEVAIAAIGVARSALKGPSTIPVTDRLAGMALDRSLDSTVRVSALRALSELPSSTLDPLHRALDGDPDPGMRAFVRPRDAKREPASFDPSEILAAAVSELPDDPAILRHAVATAGSRIPVIDLHRLLERVRERETAVSPGEQAAWLAVRGSVHQALADRESLLGVYDLREALENGKHPLPVEFVAALGRVGDASCLEPLAAAFERAGTDKLWKRHLLEAFQAIVKRLKLTKRSAVLKRIEQRHPDFMRT